ncbi:exonuclease domain-containing protein [Algibacter sp. L4_22]|uniref:exonuclease domain-containing protein n=1 Tax=Algibacter sp. L4_22 TaxID=2942477 RepID=UPI00201B5F3A|nr:exonuclease domain-containing protein [Algibacter sp. L4_22]MCL5127896.1 exonuclease domain-containing protein [Algibacter sp. L4_22]
MYAIVDIETTGGKFNEEGITEIAIYKFDGHEVVDQFISLVNPEREIQPFVVNLTGINSNMLRDAPKFYEVAKRIIEITEDCILIAHNAQFDYRILGTEFRRLGYDYKRKTLCTVELSKDLIPDQPSYSLGKLVRSLGIPVTDRHRASGDALATVKLFKLLLTKDTTKSIIQKSIKLNQKNKLDSKFLNILDRLPSATGVYYIHNAEGDIIYIGKSNNIKKRLNQHFTGTNSKSKKLQRLVCDVTYESTGSELVALLKENEEIKQNKPLFNRALRRSIFTHALYSFVDENNYINLKIDVADGRKKNITTFTNRQSAKSFLANVVEEYELCQKLAGLYKTKTSCFSYDIKACKGACIQKEAPESYNKRVNALIEKHSYAKKNMVIIDRGRDIDERTAVLIENGVFKGLGFFNLNYQINNIKVLESIITPMENNRDAQHIIKNYIRKNKRIKIINFD